MILLQITAVILMLAYGYRLIYLSGMWIDEGIRSPAFMGMGYIRIDRRGSMYYLMPFNHLISFVRFVHYALKYPEWTIKYLRRTDQYFKERDALYWYMWKSIQNAIDTCEDTGYSYADYLRELQHNLEQDGDLKIVEMEKVK